MQLAGVPVRNELVEELAFELRNPGLDDTAQTLKVAPDEGRALVALTVVDRERILLVLEECPDGLAELRAVLLLEHEGRVRQGLV